MVICRPTPGRDFPYVPYQQTVSLEQVTRVTRTVDDADLIL